MSSVDACTQQAFSGTDLLTGSDVNWSPQNEKPTVVVFLSAKCPCSKSHEEPLAQLSKDFPEFRFIGIHSNSDEDLALSQSHFKEAALPFPVVHDKSARIASDFKAFKTPHAFVIGKNGSCLFNGGVDDTKLAEKASKHYLKQALLDIRQGKEPEEKEVRTLGCIIKRT